MTIATKNITIQNETLTLTNQRAIYWEKHNALILSDIHIGKTAHFRKHGIPMPDAILQNDLKRLEQLILHFGVKQLWIVGDLFHAAMNSDMETFKAWLNQYQDIEWLLIKGNHDRLPQRLMDGFNIKVLTNLIISPFTLIHDHLEGGEGAYTISGHTHPGVLIKGKGRQKLKLPCYQVTSKELILPAFSLFTGLNTRDIPEDARCYAFTESSIFKF